MKLVDTNKDLLFIFKIFVNLSKITINLLTTWRQNQFSQIEKPSDFLILKIMLLSYIFNL